MALHFLHYGVRLRDALWLAYTPALLWTLYQLRDVPFLSAVLCLLALGGSLALGYELLGRIKLKDLQRRAVFISGCDSGFGRQLTLRCLEAGMPVFAGCLTQEGADYLNEHGAHFPGKLDSVIVNVADSESVQRAKEYLDQATLPYGGLHALVNNAGIAGNSFLDDLLDVEDYKKVAEVNTFGVVRLTHALKHLVKRTRGRIIVITSTCARVGLMGLGPYTVSKFAVSGYCEVLRQEIRLFGVSVHILEPGFFRTPIIDKLNIDRQVERVLEKATDAAKAEYGPEFFTNMRSQMDDMVELTSQDPKAVVDAYFHAITSKFPKLRYNIGIDHHLMYLPMAYMPSGLRDVLTEATFKIKGLPRPAAMQRTKKSN